MQAAKQTYQTQDMNRNTLFPPYAHPPLGLPARVTLTEWV